jgi:3-hydroxyacyl-CoA dehydrogenase
MLENPLYYSQKFANPYIDRKYDRRHGKIATVDWIIEVVVERLDIKKLVLNK